jgi:predicted nucleic acid-binding Zn ribbon protein
MNKINELIKKAKNPTKRTKDVTIILFSLIFLSIIVIIWFNYVGSIFSSGV